MKIKKYYTILIHSNDTKDSVKQWHISAKILKVLAISFGLCVLLLFAFVGDYFYHFFSSYRYQKQYAYNQVLKKQLQSATDKVIDLQSRVNQMEDFSYKLKSLVGAQDQALWMNAIGPLSMPSTQNQWFHQLSNTPPDPLAKEHEIVLPPQGPVLSQKTASFHRPYNNNPSSDSLIVHIKKLDKKSYLVQQDIYAMLRFLYTKRDILNSTPSIMPVKGWISSRFGYRQYPFTGEVSLHEGIDIAALPGTPVYAPADGEVVFAGYKSGYGNVVIMDHGWRLSTLYGHLSEIMVSVRQKVVRKEVLGVTGNTGHSSGPHLHYEVRIAGVPVDPAHYILQ